MSTTGKIHLFGDHIDTDVILPGKYLNLYTPEDLGPHCMEGIDPTFTKRVAGGDILIGGKNFGTGSSREHAPIAIKAVGVSCIVAVSFARIFYRNAINIGLPVFECPELVEAAQNGAPITADLKLGTFETNGKHFQAKPFSPYIQRIMDSGGLVNFVRTEFTQK